MKVFNEEEALGLFKKGEEVRSFGETGINFMSSRSHVIFRISIEIRSASG